MGKTENIVIFAFFIFVVYYFFLKKKNKGGLKINGSNPKLATPTIGGMPIWSDLMAEGKMLGEGVQSGKIKTLTDNQNCAVQYYSAVLLLEKLEKDGHPTTTQTKIPKTREEFFAKCKKELIKWRNNG